MTLGARIAGVAVLLACAACTSTVDGTAQFDGGATVGVSSAPDAADVKGALMAGSALASDLGIDPVAWEEYVDCVVPKLMADLSEEGLVAIVQADPDVLINGGMMEISNEDNYAAQAAFTDCAGALTDAMID